MKLKLGSWIQMNFYTNPDGPANHAGSNIGALYKITMKNDKDENNDK
jgi:hypothetical protein